MAQSQPQPSPSTPKSQFTFGKTYTFRLRQHDQDNFAGLWELCILSPQGKVVKTISDADALPYVLENLQGELENDGF